MPLRYERAIRDRIAKQVVGLSGVYGVPSGDAERLRPTPCAYVLFNGAAVEENRASGQQARIRSGWEIVLAVRNVSQLTDGAAARTDAQALTAALLAALMGWSPEPGRALPLRLDGLPNPVYESGLLLMAADFSTSYTIG